MLFALDKGLGVQAQQFAQRSQKFGGAVQANGRLQVGALQRLAQHAAKFAVHADVYVRLHQARHVGQVAAQREHHIDLGANALHHAADLGQVAGRIEGAVARANDVDARLLAGLAVGKRGARGHITQAVLLPQPEHGAVGALPLVFVNRARQKALDVGALGRHTAANHFSNRAGHHHRGQVGVKRSVGPAHGALGAFTPELFFSKTGHHNRQLVRRQRVGVMQHRCDRQVLAAHGTVNHHLHALDGGKHIHRAPVAASAIVVEH